MCTTPPCVSARCPATRAYARALTLGVSLGARVRTCFGMIGSERDHVAAYLTISPTLQIVRGTGHAFASTEGDSLEQVIGKVRLWLSTHEQHPDAQEAERWLDDAETAASAAAHIVNRDSEVRQRMTAFIEDLADKLYPSDTWAKWKVKQYHGDRIRQHEQELMTTFDPSTRRR